MNATQNKGRGLVFSYILKAIILVEVIFLGYMLYETFQVALDKINSPSVQLELPLSNDLIVLTEEYHNAMEEEGLKVSRIHGGTYWFSLKMAGGKRIYLQRYFSLIVWGSLVLYITVLLHKLVRNITRNKPFSAENSALMRRIGIIIMCLPIVTIILSSIEYSVFHQRFTMGFPYKFDLGQALLIVSLGYIIRLIGFVFERGTVINEDQSLTI